MDTLSQFVWPGAVFILTVALGIWLGISGRPYNAALFNVHKLVALAGAILTGIATYHALKSLGNPAVHTALVLVAGLAVIALFFSGAMMSAGKLRYEGMLAIHRIAPVVLVLAAAAMAYRIRTGAP